MPEWPGKGLDARAAAFASFAVVNAPVVASVRWVAAKAMYSAVARMISGATTRLVILMLIPVFIQGTPE